MHRKLVKTAGGMTFIVSLPKAWVSKHNLSAGDLIQIEELGDESLSLSVGSVKAETKKIEREINIETIDRRYLVRLIVAGYITGVDLIKLKGANLDWELQESLNKELRELLPGMEVLSSGDGELTLGVIFDPGELKLERLLTRTTSLGSWMFKNSIVSFIKNDQELADKVIESDKEVDRLTFIASRQLNKALKSTVFREKVGVTLSQIVDYRLLFSDVEAFADVGVDIAYIGKELQETVSIKNLELIVEEIAVANEKALKAVFTSDSRLSQRVIETCNNLLREEIPLLSREAVARKTDPAKISTIARVVSALNSAASITKGIAERNINRLA